MAVRAKAAVKIHRFMKHLLLKRVPSSALGTANGVKHFTPVLAIGSAMERNPIAINGQL